MKEHKWTTLHEHKFQGVTHERTEAMHVGSGTLVRTWTHDMDTGDTLAMVWIPERIELPEEDTP
jgi:hypothetical protein